MSSPLKREPQTLGERLFLVHNEHRFTWRQVAQLLDIETLDVTAYEQGHPVAQRILVAFADVFAVQWDWLLFGSGQRYTAASLLHVSIPTTYEEAPGIGTPTTPFLKSNVGVLAVDLSGWQAYQGSL